MFNYHLTRFQLDTMKTWRQKQSRSISQPALGKYKSFTQVGDIHKAQRCYDVLLIPWKYVRKQLQNDGEKALRDNSQRTSPVNIL